MNELYKGFVKMFIFFYTKFNYYSLLNLWGYVAPNRKKNIFMWQYKSDLLGVADLSTACIMLHNFASVVLYKYNRSKSNKETYFNKSLILIIEEILFKKINFFIFIDWNKF